MMRTLDLPPRRGAVAPWLALLSALVAAPVGAQGAADTPAHPLTRVSRWTPPPLPAGKRPITQDTYDEWRTIQGATLSPDGRWAVYTVTPVVGEGELVIRATQGATEYRVPRGFTGRPQLMPSADTTALFQPQPAQVSADSRFVAVLVYPPRAEVERVRARRGGPAPRNAMAIVNLADGSVTRVPAVRSFRMARNGGRWLAYQLEDTTANGTANGARAGGAAAAGAAPAATPATTPAGPRRETGTTLVLRELATGTETRVEGVTGFAFDENEQWLGYTVTGRDSAGDGVFVRDLASGATTALATGRATYRGLTFDRAGAQAAFVADLGDTTAQPRFALYHATLRPAKRQPVAARRLVAAADVPEGLRVADRGRLEFTRAGNALLFSLAAVQPDSIPVDSLADKAVYDLWHWRDAVIQPQQKVNAGRDRNRTYLALYHLAQNRWTRLATDSLSQVTVSDDARRVLALNPLQYAIEQFWGEGGADVFLLDPFTAARTLVARKVRGQAQLSPGGAYVTWFQDGHWMAHATATGTTVNLTAGIAGVRFFDEEFDSPDIPPPYGLGGWTTGDRRVLVYDRFDVWEVDPAGVAAPRNVTDGEGRRAGMTFRVVDLDPEERFLDPAQPLLLRAVDTLTKATGYWRDRLGADARPERIVMGERNYGALQKARRAEQYLLTQQTYREFPDLWTGASLTALTRLSDANPQDAQYPRGRVELVSWRSDDGVPLRGLLYTPEGFDPARQYPMVVYFYEKLTDGLHNYVAPTGRNVVNPLVYTAQGYVVFMPDIVYTEGFPGPSAAKAIIPGVQALIRQGFVDPKRIGITGQSWGGYQTAYLVTVTNLFAAAVPNATVVNMTSAYGGIRWQSGLARAFQYEHTQSRIGGSLWEYPERFLENSPLFKADRITTPLLFMANDNDGAVPWYQGIEFYVAMRRLQKEAYMVVYNGDEHNPTKRANQKDIDRKMLEFFAVKLQGADPPSWMVRGIPYLEKGRDQLRAAPVAATPSPAPRGGH
jgi:dipeptidyl aminopeptidase/acylaminoacyl peptidase